MSPPPPPANSREVRCNDREILVLSGRVLELFRDGEPATLRHHVDHLAVRTARSDDGGLLVAVHRRRDPDAAPLMTLLVPARRMPAVHRFLDAVECERLRTRPL